MAIKPTANRVIIKPFPKKEKISATGILVTSKYDKTEEMHGEVIEVGKDVAEVQKGYIVSTSAYGYDSVSDEDGNEYISVREPEILAIIATSNKIIEEEPEVIVNKPIEEEAHEHTWIKETATVNKDTKLVSTHRVCSCGEKELIPIN